MLFNYHTHTTRCNHAAGTDREYVEAAIAAGVKVLGFADHSPYVFPESFGDYSSGFRMRPEQFDDYASSVFALRDEYKGKVKILLGVEIEYYPLCFDETERFLKDRGLEYMIVGQHFTRNEHDPGAVYAGARHADDEAALSDYTDTIVKCIRSGKFLYIAHPDVIRFDGDPAIYEKQMLRIGEAARQYNVPLEINLLGYREKRRYPTAEFWRIAGEAGAPVIIGVDAHSPAHFADANDLIAAAREEYAAFGLRFAEEAIL